MLRTYPQQMLLSAAPNERETREIETTKKRWDRERERESEWERAGDLRRGIKKRLNGSRIVNLVG